MKILVRIIRDSISCFFREIQAGINATDFINATTIQDCIEACQTEAECKSYFIEANGETLVSCQLMEEVPDGATSETIVPNGGSNFFWGSDSCLKVKVSAYSQVSNKRAVWNKRAG